MKDSISAGNPELKAFDCYVCDGRCVTADFDQAYIDRSAATRRGGAADESQVPPAMKAGAP